MSSNCLEPLPTLRKFQRQWQRPMVAGGSSPKIWEWLNVNDIHFFPCTVISMMLKNQASWEMVLPQPPRLDPLVPIGLKTLGEN